MAHVIQMLWQRIQNILGEERTQTYSKTDINSFNKARSFLEINFETILTFCK